MREVTLGGKTAWLLTEQPDWTEPPTLILSVPSSIERSLTGRENRRPQAIRLRCEYSWTATLPAAALQALTAGLVRYKGSPIIAPLWPLAMPPEGVPEETLNGLVVAYREEVDGPEWSVGVPLEDPEDWDWIIPAIYGAFVETPASQLLHPEAARVRFQVREDAPLDYALSIPAQFWAAGPALGDGAEVAIFPFRINWSEPVNAGAAEVVHERREIGPGRQTAQAIYPQESERPIEGMVTMESREAIVAFLRWWQDMAAGEAHWITAQASAARLVADAPAGALALIARPPGILEAGDLLGLSSSYGPTEVVRVTDVDGENVSIEAALQHFWEASETVITPLIIARHARSTVQVLFTAPGIANARVAWRELPPEEILPAQEVRGQSIGRLPERAWLYTIEHVRAGVTQVERFTSFEQQLDVYGDLYPPRSCDHSEIRQSLQLDRDEVTLTVRWWQNCPFVAFLPGRLDTVVRLSIASCEVLEQHLGVNVRQVFRGQVTAVDFDGPFLSAAAAGASALFDRRVPALLMQTTCNWDVYGAGCGLSREAWTFSAVVEEILGDGATLILREFARAAGLPPGFGSAEYFSLGILSRADGAAAGFITRSSAIAAGKITVAIDRALSPQVAPGDSVRLAPGCDNRDVTCRAWNAETNPQGKFNNFHRFAGFPLLPATNPIVQPIGNPSGGGKK